MARLFGALAVALVALVTLAAPSGAQTGSDYTPPGGDPPGISNIPPGINELPPLPLEQVQVQQVVETPPAAVAPLVVTAPEPGVLARTGTDALWQAAAGVLLVVLGAMVALGARHSQRRVGRLEHAPAA